MVSGWESWLEEWEALSESSQLSSFSDKEIDDGDLVPRKRSPLLLKFDNAFLGPSYSCLLLLFQRKLSNFLKLLICSSLPSLVHLLDRWFHSSTKGNLEACLFTLIKL